MAEQTLDPGTPILQPSSYDPNAAAHKFESSEILWWNNGVWGACGYAIANCGGKPTSANETIRGIHRFIGAELFSLMHRDDVKFSRPFNAAWLVDLNKMLQLGIKRLGDRSVGWAQPRQGDNDHANNTPATFTCFPVPYFGERVRQQDAKIWCGQILILLSEIMQHSDNDFDDDVTDFFVSMVQQKLMRIRNDMAMKYLGYTRDQVETAGFTVPDDAFSIAKYNPAALFTSQEMVEERNPELWWPATNDLTPIKGINWLTAQVFAQRWPVTAGFYGDGGAVESAFPGGGVGESNTPTNPTASNATAAANIVPNPAG